MLSWVFWLSFGVVFSGLWWVAEGLRDALEGTFRKGGRRRPVAREVPTNEAPLVEAA